MASALRWHLSAVKQHSRHKISLKYTHHTSTPPLSCLQAGCPSCRATNSVKALKALIEYGLAVCIWLAAACCGLVQEEWRGIRTEGKGEGGVRGEGEQKAHFPSTSSPEHSAGIDRISSGTVCLVIEYALPFYLDCRRSAPRWTTCVARRCRWAHWRR